MKRLKYLKCAVFAVFAVFTAVRVYAQSEIKISQVQGRVVVFQNQTWNEATPGIVLNSQDVVKTEPGARAELVLDNTSKIWITENSEMKAGWLGKEDTLLNLVVGKIRARLSLVAGRKFRVKSPVAIVAVRGTDFVTSSAGELWVVEGLTEFLSLDESVKVEVGAGQFSMVDESGAFTAAVEMTPEQQAQTEQEWAGYEDMQSQDAPAEETPAEEEEEPAEEESEESEPKQEGKVDEFDKEEMLALRTEIREAIQEVKTDIVTTREIANEIKNADFASGRSLRDIHGNLVRVEQQLLRPDNKTLQFLNITKRDSYVYKGRFTYSGGSGSRLDMIDAKITFNKELPLKLGAWPKFIADQDEDTFWPERMHVRFTNQTDTLEMIGYSRAAGELDSKGKVLEEREIEGEMFINGWKIDTDYESVDDSVEHSGEDTDELWATVISPEIKIDKDGVTEKVRFYLESYVINNSGNILKLDNFATTPENPFAFLKTVATQGIFSCKTLAGAEFFAKGNIDIVVTPDLLIGIAKELAPEIGEIQKAFE